MGCYVSTYVNNNLLEWRVREEHTTDPKEEKEQSMLARARKLLEVFGSNLGQYMDYSEVSHVFL
jgi:hypothetical protein